MIQFISKETLINIIRKKGSCTSGTCTDITGKEIRDCRSCSFVGDKHYNTYNAAVKLLTDRYSESELFDILL